MRVRLQVHIYVYGDQKHNEHISALLSLSRLLMIDTPPGFRRKSFGELWVDTPDSPRVTVEW